MNLTEQLLANAGTRSIVVGFVDNLAERVERIKSDVVRESRIDLKLNAHELKGTAANFGYVDISTAAAAIEDKADYTSFEVLQNYVNRVELLSIKASKNLVPMQ